MEPEPTSSRVGDWVLPIREQYDPVQGAEKLLAGNAKVRKAVEDMQLGFEDVVGYVERAYENRRGLDRYARGIDTVDKFQSVIAAGVELVATYILGAPLAGAPGIAVNGVEEGIEAAYKVPFITYLAFQRGHFLKACELAATEFMSAAVPAGGDTLDILNRYTSMMERVITGDAASNILKDYKAHKKGIPAQSAAGTRYLGPAGQ